SSGPTTQSHTGSASVRPSSLLSSVATLQTSDPSRSSPSGSVGTSVGTTTSSISTEAPGASVPTSHRTLNTGIDWTKSHSWPNSLRKSPGGNSSVTTTPVASVVPLFSTLIV